MRQLTARTVEDVLRWIESTPHHFGSWELEPGFFILKGRGAKLRIPAALQRETRDLIEPGGELDARMYRANAAGQAYLQKVAQ